jgi:hypothetical protein
MPLEASCNKKGGISSPLRPHRLSEMAFIIFEDYQSLKREKSRISTTDLGLITPAD